jgi:hypothetical protein
MLKGEKKNVFVICTGVLIFSSDFDEFFFNEFYRKFLSEKYHNVTITVFLHKRDKKGFFQNLIFLIFHPILMNYFCKIIIIIG